MRDVEMMREGERETDVERQRERERENEKNGRNHVPASDMFI